jgi:curli biogenesis system outer membrane secretion channel CsgG
MNLLLLLGALVISGFVSPSFAEDQTREVVANGATKKEAIANALLEAVQQVKGTELKGSEILRSKLMESSSQINGKTDDTQVMDSSQQSYISKTTEGIIKSYSVLNVDKNSEGLGWQATLEVVIPIYKTPGISPHSLRKIAIIPFRSKSATHSIINKKIPAKEISRELNQKLVTELTQSRRFTVIDREYMTEFLKERNLVLSADSPLDEKMKVGEALGVDYLLLGTITKLKAQLTETYIKVLDETTYGSFAHFNVDFRIMVMATRQIKWSDTIKINAGSKQLNRAYSNGGDQGIIDYMLEQAAKKIVHSSLNNIYPIKILKVAGQDSIYLNQGGKMTSVGDVFEVYTQGENIVDPETGLNIKIDGEKLATIQVTKVQAKYSLAQIMDGDLNKIVAGAILRKPSNTGNNYKRRAPVQKVMQPNW